MPEGRKRTSDPATTIGCSRQTIDNTVVTRTLELHKGLSAAYSYRRASTGPQSRLVLARRDRLERNHLGVALVIERIKLSRLRRIGW
jgi:hypothetical protein